jgi:septal ring factor EnvC (AmiA/AmiB activator)
MENTLQQVFANLNQEIENLEAHARRIEELLPHFPRKAREHWKATAKARRAYEEELRVLLNLVLEKE